jgi:hypothetical protein
MRIDLQDRINRAGQITEKSAHYPGGIKASAIIVQMNSINV